ncbi:alpha/beta hydrolase [Granulicella tundricola]|uniref:Esterase n=1 Tax=Granulicella tundricola (strain ATCC BAA-1859 / DSM 23138 / MP5ACTX9) TaxID=1198114 RepID=E8X7J6_GRATM|nr:alpha/beta hydrolase [Granulicella tundricola]ADW71430.1 esterase [Granulicella tundricola MP5ACTX9]
MQTIRVDQGTASWLVQHPLGAEDEAAMTAMRAIVEPNKGKLRGVAARVPFDAIMERVSAPAGVVYEADSVGGISGWWCRPEDARPGEAVMHLHGGWFNWGSAQAFRHLAGHIARSAGVTAFVPDYRLAPEHPFPAAIEDARACYFGLIERGFTKLAVTGDSAGGNLALGLLIVAATSVQRALVGGVALSPVTDLTLSGESWSTRAVADPYFTQTQADELMRSYLDGNRPNDPLASPLYADLKGLPPLRVHVGNDEVLLDDSIRVVERAAAAGVDVRLDVWQGMVHGYLGGLGRLTASTATLQLIGDFLRERFANAAGEE